MAVATKAAAFAVFARFFEVALGPAVGDWQPALAALAAVSIVVGNVGALAQSSLKRLLGYSGIAQAGYMLAGIVAANEAGIQALFFYLCAYAFMNLAAFGVITIRERETGFGDDIRSVQGLGRERPVLAWPLTIAMLGLAGLPGTAGFIGKLYLIEASVAADYTWLGVMIAVGTMISLAYYLRVIAAVWMRPAYLSDPTPEAGHRVLPAMAGGSGGRSERRLGGVRCRGHHRLDRSWRRSRPSSSGSCLAPGRLRRRHRRSDQLLTRLTPPRPALAILHPQETLQAVHGVLKRWPSEASLPARAPPASPPPWRLGPDAGFRRARGGPEGASPTVSVHDCVESDGTVSSACYSHHLKRLRDWLPRRCRHASMSLACGLTAGHARRSTDVPGATVPASWFGRSIPTSATWPPRSAGSFIPAAANPAVTSGIAKIAAPPADARAEHAVRATSPGKSSGRSPADRLAG